MTDHIPDRSARDAYLAGLARARIAAARTPYVWRGLTPDMEEAAAALLAAVWAAGERNGSARRRGAGWRTFRPVS